MKKIIVTGCNGQLGRAINQIYENSTEFECVNTDVAELDITNIDAVTKMVAEVKPYAIINCAAHTNVDACETDVDNAYKINAIGPRNLAIACEKIGAKFVQVSTDYVFGAEGNTPRSENMPTNPLGVYGCTKLHGEQAIAEVGAKAIIIRTAWLYSEFGNNFLKTMLRLTAEKESLNVVFDQVGTPTYAGDLAMAIFSIIEGNKYIGNEGVYHFSNEGVCSWYDFAQEIASAMRHDKCKINPCHSSEFPSKVTRPPYSVLDKSKIKQTFGIEIPHWRDSMIYCLKRIYMQQAQ